MKKLLLLPLLGLVLLFAGWKDRPNTGLLLVDNNEKVHILYSGMVDASVFKNGFKAWDVLWGNEAVKAITCTFVYAPKRGDAIAWPVRFVDGYEVPEHLKALLGRLHDGDRIILADIVVQDKTGKRNANPIVFTITEGTQHQENAK